MSKGLVSCEWLRQHVSDSDVRVVDATYFLPTEGRDARAEFERAHISGAVYFDLDACCDSTSPYPHMLPDAQQFAAAMSALGISHEHHVVIYDQKGLFSAARLWWMLLVFGHQPERVSVLDGGLPRWKALGYELTSHVSARTAEDYVVTQVQKHRVCATEDVMYAVQTHDAMILDARGAARFAGTSPEPRVGVRSGHIPYSYNVAYSSLLDESTGMMRSAAQLRELFARVGVDNVTTDVIATCGSGVTACILVLALRQIGLDRVRVYDGSWAEWGARDDTPVEVQSAAAA
jgi:thiosulfate/3-mercaptopyruvate sulfurtransferase